jgi:hypothetical protein
MPFDGDRTGGGDLDEQVCLDAGVVPSAAKPSDALVYSVHEIQSTLVFHPSDRLDSKIAAVKIGQRYGSTGGKLTCNRMPSL